MPISRRLGNTQAVTCDVSHDPGEMLYARLTARTIAHMQALPISEDPGLFLATSIAELTAEQMVLLLANDRIHDLAATPNGRIFCMPVQHEQTLYGKLFVLADSLFDVPGSFAQGFAHTCAWLLYIHRQVAPPQIITGVDVDKLRTRLNRLTRKERLIMTLIPDGDSLEIVAKKATILVRTLRSHLGHMYRKLGMRGFPQTVALAKTMELLGLLR
jgi:DNA-binding CsgD family transcriptional regulator